MKKEQKIWRKLGALVLIGVITVSAAPTKISAASQFQIRYLSAKGTSVSFDVPNDSEFKEVQLLNYKKNVVATKQCLSLATFKVKKKTAYYARFRYVNSKGKATSKWSSRIGFITYQNFAANQVEDDTETVKVYYKMPKIKGVKKYVISTSTKQSKGYQKAGTAKSGKKFTIQSVAGKDLVYGKNYYVKIVPVLKDGSKAVSYQVGFCLKEPADKDE